MIASSEEQWLEYDSKFVSKLHGTYPQNGEQLQEYLKREQGVRPSSQEWEDLAIDLDSQLKLEYVLYLMESASDVNGPGMKGITFLQQLGKIDKRALKELVENVLRNGSSGLKSRENYAEAGKVEEITSYLLSSAISRGINLTGSSESTTAADAHDPVSFCKHHIDFLLDMYPSQGSQGERVKIVENSEETQDLKTAIKDLQLAYKFLKSKYENERNENLNRIETLNKTNKELSEELLHYHSKLKELDEHIKTPNPNETIEPEAFSPLALNSPNGGNSNNQSLNMMKQEFKRILADTQSKYERELQHERDMRSELQSRLKELNSI